MTEDAANGDRQAIGEIPMPATDKSHALDHMVVVLFENRSLDNVLGHLYGPDDGKTFEGVIGKGPVESDPGVG
jgi:phospholipase C